MKYYIKNADIVKKSNSFDSLYGKIVWGSGLVQKEIATIVLTPCLCYEYMDFTIVYGRFCEIKNEIGF